MIPQLANPRVAAAAALRKHPRSTPRLPLVAFVGFTIAIGSVVAIALFTGYSLSDRSTTGDRFTRTLEVTKAIESLESMLVGAETGQRGFLLTGEEQYLEPFTNAKSKLPGGIADLRKLTADNPMQQRRLDELERSGSMKTEEMEQTIALRRSGKSEAALAMVRSGRGKELMDRIRAIAAEMKGEEQSLLSAREEDWRAAATFSSRVAWGGSALLLLLIGSAAVVTSRQYRAREREVWLRAGRAEFTTRIVGEQRLDELGKRVLAFLADALDAQVGAIYMAESDGRFRRFAGYALAPHMSSDVLRPGDGLLGQAARDNRPLHVRELPADYLCVSSTLGRGDPRELLVAPASVDGEVQAVVELGFFRHILPADEDFIALISEALAVAVRTSKDRTRLEALLEETQRQAEELQTQQEELRVNNEELEEQSRALKQSQESLESQQAELELSNSQLEEQAQLLEAQKDDLSSAQVTLTERAVELERSNQYKSEFLANMSHELRTPLNSSLILAKLLAENKDGNLSREQVEFAQTIYSAGNDLLVLINDILDLSRIEAGKVELDFGPVSIRKTLDDLVHGYQPLVQEKGLRLSASIDPGTRERIDTDARRLGQILKNLLSNAVKFTETGEINVHVRSNADGQVSFAVRDSGIGIPKNKQAMIFDAFRQADGGTQRKYGGTGLGLYISQDLARLLGGGISVESTPGEGSVFTLTLPLVHSGERERTLPSPRGDLDRRPAATEQRARPFAKEVVPPSRATVPAPIEMEDDRGRLTPSSRLILVVEDDARFAAILRDLARQMGFQCVVTHSANEGLIAAKAYGPSAIVLDINLPDHSGLGVLDQLKHDPATRHVPVHVVSVVDYAQEALELGAVGYALKPVKREELIAAFQRLEAKFTQRLRRVLVVEDDERQRESIRQLLGNDNVEITGVETGAEALAHLEETTFDCMVMDLSLPDLGGYELLERMAQKENGSFPPVIVYTGRSLKREEEHDLRRFAKSIIIKDARSPERLLDEVTLFLHQVEANLPADRQQMLKVARDREAALEGRRVLVVEDDVRNLFALSRVLEPKGVVVEIARNGREAIEALTRSTSAGGHAIDLVLMDIMMPEMDGFAAMREIRKRPEWRKLSIIALTAKAMRDDQEQCLAAGANDYIAKPLDVDRLLSLVRVWMPK